MIARVLVPMDDSKMAEHALEYALDVHPDAEITVLTVVGEPSAMWGRAMSIAVEDDVEQAAQDRAAPVFERAREIASEADREIGTVVQLGNPVRAIVDRAEEYDTVVLGSHSGTLGDSLMVGNVAEKVFRRSPVPVTVVR